MCSFLNWVPEDVNTRTNPAATAPCQTNMIRPGLEPMAFCGQYGTQTIELHWQGMRALSDVKS